MTDDTFEQACNEADQRKAANGRKLSTAEVERLKAGGAITDPKEAKKQAANWLKGIAKQSAQALKKKAAKKQITEPPPDDKAVIRELAAKDATDYDRLRVGAADALGIRATTLDDAVEEERTELRVEALLEPHWEVKPLDVAVCGAALFKEIEATILKYVAMPQHLAFVVSLWIGQSWIHEHATYSPILFITSPEKECGKSTLCTVLGFLTRRGLTSVGITAPVVFRAIEKWSPTLIVDEGDTVFDRNPDLCHVVNSGWVPGQGVIRCDPVTHEPQRFLTFCPKVVALIKKQAPDTILSRSIFIELKRRTRAETVADFSYLDAPDFGQLRSELARWAADHGATLGQAKPQAPERFMNRLRANWQMLIAIAESIGRGDEARQAARRIAGATDVSSAAIELLKDVAKHFDCSTLDYVPTKALIASLTADPERPWAEYSRGKPITERELAALLRDHGIHSRNVGPREAQAKGYRRADFLEAWGRYLTAEEDDTEREIPPSDPSTRPPPCNIKGNGQSSAVRQESGGRQENGDFSNEINTVGAWTAEKGVSTDNELLGPPGDTLDDFK